ncbi:MAG: MASE3 domain-containing protein, partial [bacterium]
MEKVRKYLFINSLIIFSLLILFKKDLYLVHSIIEILSILVAFNIFIIAYNTRKFTGKKILLFLGTAYLAVGIFDLLHMFEYHDIQYYSDTIYFNKSLQYWIVARFVESFSLMMVPVILIRRWKIDFNKIIIFYLTFSTVIILSIMKYNFFPFCYTEKGLTLFKIYSEYLVCILLLISCFLFWKFRSKITLSPEVLRYLFYSLALTIISEYLFTRYDHISSPVIFWGHIFKLFSFYFIYKSLIEESLQKPYQNLFEEYSSSQKKLIATGSMISTMFHDIKNPLTNISALAQMGEKFTQNKKIEKYFHKIINYVDNLTRMMNNILNSYKPEEFDKIDLIVTIREIVMKVDPLLKENNIKLETEFNEIEKNIFLDKNLFKRVIHNLINNAVKAMENGGKIKIKVKDRRANVLISIEDNGPGIPETVQSKIFQPFNTGGSGTGLGLYMVSFTVENIFQGKVWFETSNKGTTFYIILPKEENLHSEINSN